MKDILECVLLIVLILSFIGLIVMQLNEIIKSNRFYKILDKEREDFYKKLREELGGIENE